MNANVTFDRIESAYCRLGYDLNWGFLTCPREKFLDPRVLLVGLNPGGGRGDGDDRSWERQKVFSEEGGNSYLFGEWEPHELGQAPLQLQVQGLCKFIDVNLADVASANFVPFQSPSWGELPKQAEALAFAREIWCDLARDIKPEIVIGLGLQVGYELARLFGVDRLNAVNSGWGATKIRFGQTQSGGRLVILPHLSRYRLFNPDGSENRYSSPLKVAFGLGSVAHA